MGRLSLLDYGKTAAMKTALLIFICFLSLLLLCGCGTKEQNGMEIETGRAVTFINGVSDADVWILPQTEKNLKTTVWGPACASQVKTGERRQTPLCESGDDGLYIFRMIDNDKFYYSANGITLDAGWSLHIKESDNNSVFLEVSDENGVLNNTYEVFSARL